MTVTIDTNSDTKSNNKPYSTQYGAVSMRKRRKEFAKIDPLYPQRSVWIIEVNGKQYVFAGKKRDIPIKRIPKSQLKEGYVKMF